MKLNNETRRQLIELFKDKKIFLEGNILKVLDADGDAEFENYIKESIEKDSSTRRKRLDITRQVQSQNIELIKKSEESDRSQIELKEALNKSQTLMAEAEKAREEANNAKSIAENDLDIIQKKGQFELIGTIVKVALCVILGVGVITTGMYLLALSTGLDTSVIGSTWSNIIGILLTNAFSIVGTIMGVKYATENNNSK